MENQIASIVIMLLGLCGLNSCASYKAAAIDSVAPLTRIDREDVEILESTEGNGCATFISLFPFPIAFTYRSEEVRGEIRNVNFYDFGLQKLAREVALYKAIESVPQADLLLASRYHDEVQSVFIWYINVCSKVKGKAVRIKTDKENIGRGRTDTTH